MRMLFTLALGAALLLAPSPAPPTASARSLALLGVFPEIELEEPRVDPEPRTETAPVTERVAARPPGWQGPLPPAEPEAPPEDTVAVVPQSLRAVAPEPDPLIRDGKYIHVELKSAQIVSMGDPMKFVATLFNATDAHWNLVAEIVVRKGDGSQETLLQGYPLRLASGRQMRVPLGLKAREQRFPPGITEFVAFLRDRQGELVDRASIAFVVTVPLH